MQNKLLINYKNESGLSFRDISLCCGMHRTAAFYAIHHPWRTSLKTFMKIAILLQMPENDAKQEWAEAKKTLMEKKINSQL